MSEYHRKINIMKAIDPDFSPLPPKTSSDVLVELKNIHLSFSDHYYLDSIRDRFIKGLKNPLNYFISNEVPIYVLKELNFKVSRGERVGIMGTNGCGKTSLCRVISETLFPQIGEIHINGTVNALYSTTVGPNPFLTGRENIKLLTDIYFHSKPREFKEDVLARSCEFSELKDRLDSTYMYYSKGMQARVFLSMAMYLNQDVLILDEVFDGADESFRLKVRKKFDQVIEDSKSFIFVSHSFEQIRQLCSRCVVLHKGHIYYDGDAESAYQRYKELVQEVE